MRRLLLLSLLIAASTPVTATGQTAAEPPASAVAADAQPLSAGSPDLVAQTADPSSGLPLRSNQPRTLRAYWHLFIAFAVTWVLLFGYALTIGRRFGKLEDEVARLKS